MELALICAKQISLFAYSALQGDYHGPPTTRTRAFILKMAAAFSFNFVVGDDKHEDFKHCKPRISAEAFESSSPSISQAVEPAKQHTLDLQDEFYTELLDHVTLNCYQPDAKKSSGGLYYLKLEEVKQWFLRQAGTLLLHNKVSKPHLSMIERCGFQTHPPS